MNVDTNLLLYLGAILFLAYLVKITFSRFKLPEVTGYVLLGVLLGVSLLKVLDVHLLKEVDHISSIALGIIAFIIGSELKGSVIKKLGKSILFIVLFECLGAFTVVTTVMLFVLPGKLYLALLLGSVASATAPAATVAVMNQYKAKGDLTSTVMAVVGIDDAMALIIYVFASSFASSFMTGADIHILKVLLNAVISIGLSFLIGVVASIIYIFLMRKVRNNDWIKLVITAFILGILGICEQLQLSELLSIMVFGAVISNWSPMLAKRSGDYVQYISPIFLTLFFIFGGAHLNIGLIGQIGVTGLIYFAARSVGKIGGGTIGAYLGKASPNVRKYVGLTLLPQVGVALALALAINKKFNTTQYGAIGHNAAILIINILLLTTVITEILGPMLTRWALFKSGEIDLKKSK